MRHVLALSAATGLVLAASQAPAQSTDSAPPSRVGQIALLRDGVSFNAQGIGTAPGTGTQSADAQGADSQGSGGWTTAQLNYPVTAGDTLYTQPDAEAAIAVDWSRITLSGSTEFAVTALDDRTLQATEAQGEAYLDLRYLPQGDQFIITTPRGTVIIARGGRYDIIAGDQNTPTRITVIAGAASVNGQDVAVSVGPGETATLNGDHPVTASLGGARSDRFIASLAHQAVQTPPAYVPQSVSQMTGGDELSQYGSWAQESQYGAVWYPRVAPGWVPYRSGHWDYVRPWGWTWVASEPWGFAPFHYGRWVDIDDRWGWAPSPVQSEGYAYSPSYSWPAYNQSYKQPDYYQQPIYAPALVSFFAIGAGVAITAGSIGWVPLAPDEPYYPPYRCPPRYIRQINVSNVRNVTHIDTINRTTVINSYANAHGPARLVNRRAATFIPAAAMRRGDPVAHFGRPAPATILAAAHPVAPAGFRAPPAKPGHIGPGHPGPDHPGPGRSVQALARLPAAPPLLAHHAPAPAPRPAVFAAARGLPVAHPGPIHPAAARVLGVPDRRAINQPTPHGPGSHPAPFNHAPPANQTFTRRPAVIQPPGGPGRQAAQPPARFAAPGFQHQLRQVPPPPQAANRLIPPQAANRLTPPRIVNGLARAPGAPHPAQHMQAPGRPPISVYHPPAQPVFHPPVQPVFHPPVQPVFHPPVQPVFHPPVQPAFHPPAFHPPIQQPRPAPRPAPDRQPERRP